MQTDDLESIADLATRLAEIRSRLSAVDELEDRLREIQSRTIVDMRASGSAWKVIAEIAGVSRQRAEQLSRTTHTHTHTHTENQT